MKKLLLVVILLIFAMALTNPSQTDYNSWINDNLADKLNYNAEGALGKAISPLAGIVADTFTERHNYVIFSIYETNVGDTHITKTLGIFKLFIDLK